MTRHVVRLRGINVRGKNKVPMAALKDVLQGLGFTNVATYLASATSSWTPTSHLSASERSSRPH